MTALRPRTQQVIGLGLDPGPTDPQVLAPSSAWDSAWDSEKQGLLYSESANCPYGCGWHLRDQPVLPSLVFSELREMKGLC